MVGAKLVRVLTALVLVLVVWGVPGRATAATGQCIDARPGAAPVVDHVGTVGVPHVYCYNPGDRDHKDWHDYCSAGQGDSWSKGGVVVSFKGPCAYHDLCLEYGWGFSRSSCDAIFRVYMVRNCDETVGRSKIPSMLKGWVSHMCREKAARMYTGVDFYTSHFHPSYRPGPWLCLLRPAGKAAACAWRFPW